MHEIEIRARNEEHYTEQDEGSIADAREAVPVTSQYQVPQTWLVKCVTARNITEITLVKLCIQEPWILCAETL